MRLTLVCLKRKPIIKPDSFVRSWQWNTAWYLNQDRKIINLGMKESLMERNMEIHQLEDLYSPIIQTKPKPPVEIVETVMKKIPHDENHPLWQEEPAYTYGDRTWLPKNCQIQFASALTNTAIIKSLPDRIGLNGQASLTPSETISRIETLIKNAYLGDATQKLLPRNFRVPYIGWDPVESKMRPRNLYDHTKNTWGRSMPREYGIPNKRKVSNLCRGLIMESTLLEGVGTQILPSTGSELHRQFITRPNGKLMRFNLNIPISTYSRKPLSPITEKSTIKSMDASSVAVVDPMDPVATLHPTNIYHPSASYPVASTNHSHPFAHTVWDHYTSHISPQWNPEWQQAKALMLGFCASLGQARLRWGENVSGDLPEPVCTNVISTDGQKYQLGTFQLNSLDLQSNLHNLFWMHPENMDLFQHCGYVDGRGELSGLNIDTFSHLKALITDGLK